MSDSQMVCIERPEPGLPALFEEMYHNQRLVDVTIKCMNGQVHAHKLVLAACSEYFNDIFDDLAEPSHYPIVVIKDMRIEDFTLILEFMYRGRLALSQERMQEIIRCAKYLQIHGLSEIKDDGQSRNTSDQCQISTHDNTKSQEPSRVAERMNKISMFRSTTTLLEQSMVTEDTPEDSHASYQVSSYSRAGPMTDTSFGSQVHFSPVTSMRHVQQHLSSIDRQQHLLNQRQQQLSNNIQVLTHSLANDRSSGQKSKSSSGGRKLTHGIPSHICNICFVSFSRKANLERHILNLHSMDRLHHT